VVAQYQNELPKFFKRYQIQPVWRADRPARGRFREFYQCDVDVLGSHSMVVESELIAAASDALAALGFNDFTIRLNHRQVLTGILDQAGLAREKHVEALIALDKMDKAGPEGVAQELTARGIVDESAVKLMRFFEGLAGAARAVDLADFGDGARPAYNADVLGRLVEFIGSHEIGASGVDDLRQIIQFAKASGADQRIKLDPTLARGLAYYTGAIIEINVADLAGSLGGGGRYDNLVGIFLGKDVPACGFSLGLERIIVVMSERAMFPPALVSSPADVMVTVWNEDSVNESMALATELRSKGLRVDLYPEADKLAKQFKYASSREIPYVAIVGEEERLRGEVAIKDMKNGEQRSVKREEVVDAIRPR
jgi:histidyl-tRNA synthetase